MATRISSQDTLREWPLTVFLNAREAATVWTIGNQPELLGIGHLLGRRMLEAGESSESENSASR